MREQEIQRIIQEFLQYRCWLVWRNNSGGMTATHQGKKRFIRFNSAVGSSDLFAVAPDGRFVSIEVKRPGNKPTAHQADWLARVTQSGGISIVATSLDDVIHALTQQGYSLL